MENIKMENNFWGSSVTVVAQKAQALATSERNVEFDFNGITCIVSPTTDLAYLIRDYQNAFTMDWKTVGPDCNPFYEEEVQKELDRKNEARELAIKKAQEEYEREQAQKTLMLESRIKNIDFAVSNKDSLKKWEDANTDPYGGGVISYGKRWARLMQYEIGNGKRIIDVAEKCSHEADTDGITGFMYGAAVQFLSTTWLHGEDLRKWHNKEYQHEGDGVVNPAVLTTG